MLTFISLSIDAFVIFSLLAFIIYDWKNRKEIFSIFNHDSWNEWDDEEK